MKLIINIKCYCEFVICFYFCSGLTEHKNERKRKRQDFYSMAVVNDAYATTLMVLGFEKSKQLLARHPELAAMLITSANGKFLLWHTPNYEAE